MQRHRARLCAFHAVVLAELLVGGGSVNLRNVRHDQSAAGSVRHDQSAASQFFQYDYSKHGQEWVAGACASRSRQSPINLPAGAAVTGTFAYKYNPIVEPFEFLNNGHAYSAELAGLGYGGITYENAWYNLMNINIHSLSEHTWNGIQMPLELHLVHKRYDGEGLLIVAIPVESPFLTGAAMAAAIAAQERLAAMPGNYAFLQTNKSQQSTMDRFFSGKQAPPAVYPMPTSMTYLAPPALEPLFNPTLQMFLKMEPPPVNMKIRVPADPAHAYDLNAFLTGGTFFEYAGSLTAPPCAEIVTWLVREETIKASDKQLIYLHDAIYKITADFGNFRSIMPLNGRVIAKRQGLLEDLPPTAAPPVSLPGKPQQSDREFRAMKWAMDAMTIAKSATDYVKDLDSRLRNAAQAHANALAPQMEPLMVHGQAITVGDGNQLAQPPMGIGQMEANGLAATTAVHTQSPLEMQKTAETMARTLASAAREEIDDATREISIKSKDIAMQAAREAAEMVLSGNGHLGSLASGVQPPGSVAGHLPGMTGGALQPGMAGGLPAQPGMPQQPAMAGHSGMAPLPAHR